MPQLLHSELHYVLIFKSIHILLYQIRHKIRFLNYEHNKLDNTAYSNVFVVKTLPKIVLSLLSYC